VATAEKSDKLISFAMATGHAERDMLSPELRAVLETLTQDARNNVFVVSGKEQPAVVQVSQNYEKFCCVTVWVQLFFCSLDFLLLCVCQN